MDEYQRKVTETISAMYTMETFKPASYQVDCYDCSYQEIPEDAYVEWLERKVYESINGEKGGA